MTDGTRGDRPWTHEEDDAIAFALGGQAGLDELRKVRTTYDDGSWKANSVMVPLKFPFFTHALIRWSRVLARPNALTFALTTSMTSSV